MPAAFRKVLPYAGVDEKIPSGAPASSSRWGGSNVVILEDGPNHRVASNLAPAIQVDELTDPHYLMALVNAQFPMHGIDQVHQLAMMKAKTVRVFKVTAHSLVGLDVAKVQATHPRTSKVEATLKVLVLKQKVVKIAIRPVQVRDDRGNPVTFTDAPFDPQALLDRLNFVWKHQANIVFQLGRTDPAVIDGLSPRSEGADHQNPTMAASFLKNKDPGADFTAFLVRRAFDGHERVSGVTDARAGYALIDDDRSPTTLAHEAGHFLGALDGHGKYEKRYGHQGTDPDLLMRDGGAGWKIPFGLVTDFNKGYRKP